MGRGKVHYSAVCCEGHVSRKSRSFEDKPFPSIRFLRSGPLYYSSSCTDLFHCVNQYRLSKGQVQPPPEARGWTAAWPQLRPKIWGTTSAKDTKRCDSRPKAKRLSLPHLLNPCLFQRKGLKSHGSTPQPISHEALRALNDTHWKSKISYGALKILGLLLF